MTSPADSFNWQEVFNAIGNPAIILDREHRITAANVASIRLTGLQNDEIIGRFCFEVFHRPDSTEPPKGCPMQKMLQSGELESTDMEMEALDGIFMVSCTPVLATDGSLDKVIHIATDITERKRAEQEMQACKSRFQAVLDNLDVNVYVADMETHELLFLNKQGKETFGDIVGEICWKTLQSGQDGPCPFCTNDRLIRPDGTIGEPVIWELQNTVNNRWYECRDQAIRWTDGRLVRLEISTDITDKKQIGFMLLEQKQFNESLVQYSTIATFAIDSNHNAVIWNRACEVLTGCSAASVLGTSNHRQTFYHDDKPTLADAVLDGDISRLSETYNRVAPLEHNPDGFMAEGWFTDIGGKDRYLLIEAAPVFGIDGEIVTVIETVHDLTNSKTIEEQLIHSQKLESIGHLAGGVAHEFNNILAVIVGYGQLVRKALPVGSKAANDLDHILAAGERAAELTSGMLAFSRKQHMFKRSLDLNRLIHDALKSFRCIIGDNITILEALSDTPLPVYADNSLIVQVLMNLVTNSRDAITGCGSVEISTELAILQSPLSTSLSTVPPGTFAKLSVSDTGHGIDDELMHRIFEPFFTTKEVGKGTGLGLAVAYGIVDQHGGYFTVSSKKDAGTVFDVYLPLLNDDAVQAYDKGSSDVMPGGSETILLADDDQTILSLFVDILSELGYRVIAASDGVDAVDKFLTYQGSVDLLVFDVQMKRMSGLEAFRKIRQMTPDIRALFVSGFNVEQFAAENELEQGTDLLAKPFIPGDFARKIRELLDLDASVCR